MVDIRQQARYWVMAPDVAQVRIENHGGPAQGKGNRPHGSDCSSVRPIAAASLTICSREYKITSRYLWWDRSGKPQAGRQGGRVDGEIRSLSVARKAYRATTTLRRCGNTRA